jgi:excisionase family DNA binding protein
MTEERTIQHAGDAGHHDDQAGPLPQVMTVDQVAGYLQLSKRTVYNMAAAGEIPAAKVGDQWRFFRPELDRWLERLSRANVGELASDPVVRLGANGKV